MFLSRALRDAASNNKTCSYRIVVKHLHRLQRILIQVFSNQRQLFQYVAGSGNDMTSDGIGLEYVEQFARTRPDQLQIWIGREYLDRLAHQWRGIASGICDAAGEHRYAAGLARLHGVADLFHL